MSNDTESLGRSFVNFRFDSVAHYTILEHIGSGGMGIVFLAQRSTEGVHDSVVLKTIRDVTPETLEELRQEANLATRLRHPNIIRTYGLETVPFTSLPQELQKQLVNYRAEGAGQAPAATSRNLGKTPSSGVRGRSGLRRRRLTGRRRGARTEQEINFPLPKKEQDGPGLSFIVMDYIDGVDLLDLHLAHVAKGMLIPPMLSAYIIARTARALEYAHNVLIHRDISPGNVLIDSLGMPLLGDFGVAVASGTSARARAGKLSYIAPEVLAGRDMDERVDIYSLGLLAYLLASGITLQRVPRGGSLDERIAWIMDQVKGGFPSLDEAMHDVPEAYARIVARMISPDPDKRPPRAGAVASEIEQQVLYADGFGPTNQSLASYIDIFERGFDYHVEQVEQLGFLRDPKGELALRRELSLDLYTDLGKQLIAERDSSALALKLTDLEAERRARAAAPESAPVQVRGGRPMLKIRFGDNCMESIELGGELVLGRSARDADVLLVDTKASRRHARISLTKDGALLEDLESGNGTFVDGRKVNRLLLEEGTRFRIGDTMTYFVREPELLPPGDTIKVEGPLESSLLDQPGPINFRLASNKRPHLGPIWSEVALQHGMADRAGYLLSQALFEACGLVALEDESLTIQLLRERAALRFLLWGPAGGGQVLETLNLLKQLINPRAEVELGAGTIAATLVRQVFDRVDVYVADGMLLLSKSF